ncbi:MAG: arsenite S-adenosylmethyltransferase [Lentisphaerae bacterium RIFOXYB12_FULL_65_16]|nr:MAG: arsenite S-adenosylmethyltransferase [Lentisphaerae bacterium RIFOXYA12_64_32]OGV88416.1 MAG: arsenite S-adenosylmethyltransferase [Lentisphaerae bacterium RIFOXYB12_FULL_65_16]
MCNCCSKKTVDKDSVREKVRAGYAKIAAKPAKSGAAGSCCGTDNPEQLAQRLGYSEAELAVLPEGANMGLSCGNPAAIAALRPGEVVLDLGSGGGFDVFVAARQVGKKGRAIGVDMTPEMITKARRNAEQFRRATGLANVEFRLGEIEYLPVADNSVDAIISNCVINLSPDKPQVWRDLARVLKPGGRVAVSDLALRKRLPKLVQESVAALVGCVAGAVLVKDTVAMARAAGLAELQVTLKPDYIDSMTEWNDPLYRTILKALPKRAKLSDYVTSMYVTARKP